MKILRNVLGTIVEIKLTTEELYQAYLEQEEAYDIQDVQERLKSYYGREDEFSEKYGVALDRVSNDKDLIYSIAVAKRLNIDKYDMNWEAALDEAFDDCLLGLDG